MNLKSLFHANKYSNDLRLFEGPENLKVAWKVMKLALSLSTEQEELAP